MARFIFALVLITTIGAGGAGAQQLTIPQLDWRTVRTQHFDIHYPASAEMWTLDLATRIESVRHAVSRIVGSAPDARVTIVVEDPGNESNGFAIPLIRKPIIFLWPTPPGPHLGIAESRGWSEILSVHEYAHIAHLTRPTRSPFRGFLARLSPVRMGPVALKSPRWVSEGYATWVEGRLTGSGRPHGAWRAAILRQWALEGKLPTYAQLNSDRRFYGGSMAYLVGSAYLEWLEERSGDLSLVRLWRRMSARQNRTFDDAFAGVFAGYPADLYGRFAAELTGKALDAERVVDSALATAPDSGVGRTVQALSWNTGAPAVSPDGKLIALVVRGRDKPSRVVVWKTADEPLDSTAIRARERMLRLDPEDVPAVQWRPRPKKAVAVLYPSGGVPYDEPRFLPGGDEILLVRSTGRGDGATRPDLFVWNFRTGQVRRVTHGAGLRHADPSPDGRYAVGDRCVEGICDVVRVDLGTGATTVLLFGSPRVVYDRPRYSHDGRTIAMAVQLLGRWRVALLRADAGPVLAPRFADPNDGANRYDPSFLPGDTALVVTSDATGIPNIEVVDLKTGETRTLTLATGAALAPDVDGLHHAVYFLRLRSNGLDLNAVPIGTRRPELHGLLSTDSALTPATRVPPVPAPAFRVSEPGEPQPYGLGPRVYRFLPTFAWTAEGKGVGLAIAGTDPVGRLTWVAQGRYGDRGTWRGGSLGAAWRGARPLIGASMFYAEDHPSRQHGGFAAPAALDIDYWGGIARVELERDNLTNVHRLRLGASSGRMRGASADWVSRSLGFAEYRGAVIYSPGEWRVAPSIGVLGETGQTGGSSWSRGIVNGGAVVSYGKLGIRADAMFGAVSGDAPAVELFSLGGTAPPLFDRALLAQRVVMPALPTGLSLGTRAASYRIGLPGDGIRPYFWSASVGNGLRDWHHVVGLEWSYELTGLWSVGFPDTRFTCGIGYSLSEPFEHETRGYVALSYRP
jgi:Tol biopolymer transport system component